MAVLVKDGKILTIDGKTIKAPSGGGSNVSLFAPVLTASDKTITMDDVKNGAFAESHNLYLNNKYISNIDGALDVTSHLSLDKDTQTFTATSSGLLSNSEKSNGINYHRVVFKNQDETVLITQIELENEVFKYDGTEPMYEGNFYGWNKSKTAVTRELELNATEPTIYYAIYTNDFADSVVLVGEYEELNKPEGSNIYPNVHCVNIDNKIYILANNSIHMFNPTSSDKSLTYVGDFATNPATAYESKIYTLSSEGYLSVFNTQTGLQEDNITLQLSEDLSIDYLNESLEMNGDYVYFFAKDSEKVNHLVRYELSTNAYITIQISSGTTYYKGLKIEGGVLYYWDKNQVMTCDFNTNEKTMLYNYGGASWKTTQLCRDFLNGKMYGYDVDGTMMEINFNENTIRDNIRYQGKLTIMESALSNISNSSANSTYEKIGCARVGSAIYFIGAGLIQKYY